MKVVFGGEGGVVEGEGGDTVEVTGSSLQARSKVSLKRRILLASRENLHAQYG
jgi:hypothetical protein